jgi:glycine/D-amino acid oxidase-like deaminating enzyme
VSTRLCAPTPTPQRQRSWWLSEALAADPGEPCPPLAVELQADVVILGGGYTGMWTALQLKELDPSVEVVLLEADICGSGPSGRNGGFMYGLWEDLAELTRRFGSDEALRTCFAADAMVDDAAQRFADAGIDIWFRRAGHLCVSTSPIYDDALRDAYAEYQDAPGVPDAYFQLLDANVVAERVRSLRFRGALWGTRTGTVQPARLARGLRRLCLDRGVRIFEQSPVTEMCADSPIRVATPNGSVIAEHAVLGLNAWSDQVPGIGRRIVSRASHLVLTEPAPELLAEIGWTGGEALDDFRSTVDYVRTTNDGRIAFGQGTGDAAHANAPRLAHDPDWQRRIALRLVDWFPEFRDVRIDASWGGPVDVASSHLPFVGRLGNGSLHFAAGYSGSGVGASVLCGRILASQVLGRNDEFATLPLAHYVPRAFPVQPVLGLGARIVLPAIVRTEDAWEANRKPGAITRFLAGMPRRLGYNLGP